MGKLRSLKDVYKKLTVKSLKKTIDIFMDMKDEIGMAKPALADAELIISEFRNAASMAIIGVQRGICALDGSLFPEMEKDLLNVIAAHEKLWLSRNRPGGLRESTGRLLNSLEYITGVNSNI